MSRLYSYCDTVFPSVRGQDQKVVYNIVLANKIHDATGILPDHWKYKLVILFAGDREIRWSGP